MWYVTSHRRDISNALVQLQDWGEPSFPVVNDVASRIKKNCPLAFASTQWKERESEKRSQKKKKEEKNVAKFPVLSQWWFPRSSLFFHRVITRENLLFLNSLISFRWEMSAGSGKARGAVSVGLIGGSYDVAKDTEKTNASLENTWKGKRIE